MKFLFSKKFLLGIIYAITATVMLFAVPPRITGAEWWQVIGVTVISFLIGRVIVDARVASVDCNLRIVKTIQDKINEIFTKAFVGTLISCIMISIVFYLGKIDFSLWFGSYTLLVASYGIGNAVSKKVSVEDKQ